MSSEAIWPDVKDWSPFKIDALGLVTMLGADEVDRLYGQLVTNPWCDWLPQLGFHIVASTRFRERIPGFQIFNVTQGIMTNEVAPWLARWLMSQEFAQAISVVTWKVKEVKNSGSWPFLIGPALAIAFDCFLILLPALQQDWWGLSNSIAIVSCVCIRQYLLWESKREVDKVVCAAVADSATACQADESKQMASADRPPSSQKSLVTGHAERKVQDPDEVEVLCILPSGQLVTMLAPSVLMRHCLVGFKRPDNPRGIKAAKMLGWFFLVVMLLSIGQATLSTQIVSVVLMVLSTVAATYKIGCDGSHIGSRLEACRDKAGEKQLLAHFRAKQSEDGNGDGDFDRRMMAYARLKVARTEAGADSLELWDLVPQKHTVKGKQWRIEFAKVKQMADDYDEDLGSRAITMLNKSQRTASKVV